MNPALVQAGAAAAGSLALAAAYLDAKFWISKDLNTINRAKQGLKNWDEAVKRHRASGFLLFASHATNPAFENEICIWSRERTYTWSETLLWARKYGVWFREQGVKPGEYVGLCLMNSAEFIVIWLGLLSIGAAPALINYNLATAGLQHCIRLSGTRILIYDGDEGVGERVAGCKEEMEGLGIKIVKLDSSLMQEVGKMEYEEGSSERIIKELGADAPLGLMFTSGTTGLPKAAALKMSRQYPSASLPTKTFGQRRGPKGDRTYICMPLYHGTAGLAAMNDVWSGMSVAVGRRFSRGGFWEDVRGSGSTVFIYVGETARYLLSNPPSVEDRKHDVRLMWGNGLQADVWRKFQDRFGIPEIGEFYASTEGMLTLINHSRLPSSSPLAQGIGAIGHHGLLLRHKNRNNYACVEIDAETNEIIRDGKTGFAKRKAFEEGGEVLVRMEGEGSWAGYWRDGKSTGKRVVKDVFERGDCWFRSGDRLRRDEEGFWWFLDRLGDTYRWKGENVSTTEVQHHLSTFSHPSASILEANVYGIQLPHHDGRAGCAALILGPETSISSFPWDALYAHLATRLPKYAIPVFLRIVDSAVGSMSTENNKQSKVGLREEGVDPGAVGTKTENGRDRFLWVRPGGKRYEEFGEREWKLLVDREVTL